MSLAKRAIRVIILFIILMLAITILFFSINLDFESVAYAEIGDISNQLNIEQEYTHCGSYYTYMIPYNGMYKLQCWGAQGGSIGTGVGGKGGYVEATGYFTTGQVLYIYVGGKGGKGGTSFNGGGKADPNCTYDDVFQNATSGGGATDIRINSTDLSSRILVAGGGGGAGTDFRYGWEDQLDRYKYSCVNGGAGGGTSSTDNYDNIGGFVGQQGFSNRGIGGAGGSLTGGYSLGQGQDNGSERKSCWCNDKSESNQTDTISNTQGGGIGAGGGGYYGGEIGEPDTPSEIINPRSYSENSYLYYAYSEAYQSALGGGGGSSYISGFMQYGKNICAINAGYNFEMDSNYTTKGRAEGNVNSGDGKAKITFLGNRNTTDTATNIQRIEVRVEGWYNISTNGPKINSYYGDYVQGYIYLDEGQTVFIKTATSTYNSGVTEIRVGPFSAMDKTTEEIEEDYENAKTIIKAGGGGKSSNTFVSGGKGYGVNAPYVVCRPTIKKQLSSRDNSVVTFLYLSADLSLAQELNSFFIATSTQTFTIDKAGKYAINAWGEFSNTVNGSSIGGERWLVKDSKIDVVFSNGTVTAYFTEKGSNERIQLLVAGAGDSGQSVNDEQLISPYSYSQINSGDAFFSMNYLENDTEAPTNPQIYLDRPGVERNGTLYYSASVNISFGANDDGSGNIKYKYRVGESGTFVEGDSFTLEPSIITGTENFIVYMYAVDYLGNGTEEDRISKTIAFNLTMHTATFYIGGDNEPVVEQYLLESPIITPPVANLAGFDFVGWYRIINGELSEDENYLVTEINPNSDLAMYNPIMYALYAIKDVTFGANTPYTEYIYNCGNYALVNAPTYSHEAENVAFGYAWERKVENNYGVLINQTAEVLALSWKTDLQKIGQYRYRIRITPSAIVEYTEEYSKSYSASLPSYGEEINIAVLPKPFTITKENGDIVPHADIALIGADTTCFYTGAEIKQSDLAISDKGTRLDFSKNNLTVFYENNINVSTDEIKASLTITANEGSNYDGSITTEFIILPKPITELSIDICEAETYIPDNVTGFRPKPNVSWERKDIIINDEGNQETVEIEIQLTEGIDFDYAYGENINAGNGTVTIICKGNYSGSKQNSFIINKANPIIDVSGVIKEYTYTGLEQTVNSGATVNTDQILTYTDNKFTKVSEGNGLEVKITAWENDNYNKKTEIVKLIVNRAETFIDISNIVKEYTYNGKEQQINYEAVTTLEQTGVISYINATFTDVPLENDDTGYYFIVEISVTQSANYKSGNVQFKVYVKKSEYELDLSNAEGLDFTYDGKEHTLTNFVTVLNTDQYESIEYFDNILKNVSPTGEYDVGVTVNETRNYNEKTVKVKVEVLQAKPILSTGDMITTYSYNNGMPIIVNEGAEAYGVIEEDDANLIVEYVNNVFLTVADSGNMLLRVKNKEGFYNYATLEREIYISIIKADPVVPTFIDINAEYGQTLGLATGLPSRDDGIYSFEQGNDTDLGTVNNPSTSITIKFSPIDTANYNIIKGITAVVTLLKASRVLDISKITTDYVYNGKKQYFTGATVGDTESEIIYTPSYFTTVAEMNGKTLTVSISETDNYLSATKTLTVNVDKATEIIDVSGIAEITYDGNSHIINSGAFLHNNEQNNSIVYSENSFVTVAEAEKTTVNISANETDNYHETNIAYYPIMHRATTIFDHSAVNKEFTYDGTEITVSGAVVINNTEQSPYFTNNVFTTVPEGRALIVRINVLQSANYAEGFVEFTLTVHKAIPVTKAQSVEVACGKTLMNATGLEPNYTFIDGSAYVGTVKNPTTGLFVRYTPAGKDADNYEIINDVPLTITVVQGSPELSTVGIVTEYTYNGNRQFINSGATINNKEQTIIYSNNHFITVSEGQGMVVNVSVQETENFFAESKNVTIRVNKAEPQFDLSGVVTEFTYNRTQQKVDGVVVNNSEQIVKYSTNVFTTVSEGLAIGSVKAIVQASENYAKKEVIIPITVNKAQQEIDVTEAQKGFIYNGEKQYVTASVMDSEQTLSYENNSFVTVAEGNGLVVKIIANESDNYKKTERIISISVAKRIPETQKQVIHAYYGQILNELEAELVQGYSFEQLLITSVGLPSNPTEISLKYTPNDTDNEEIVEGVAGELIVSQRPIIITLNNIVKEYGENGYQDAELTYNLSDNAIVGDDELEINIEKESGAVPGEYVITATVGNELYNASIINGTYTIEKRRITIALVNNSSYYGEPIPNMDYKIIEGSLYSSDTLSGNLSLLSSPTIVADYSILNTINNSYYDITLLTPVYKIVKRPITVYAHTSECIYGNEYNFLYSVEKRGEFLTGEALVSEDTLGGKLKIESNGIGRFEIQCELFNSNYDIEYVSAICTVKPRPITVNFTESESMYGDEAEYVFKVTEGSVIEGDDIGAIITANGTDVGEHNLSAEFSNENYDVTYISAQHTILPRPITVKLGNQTRTRLEYSKNTKLDNDKYIITAGNIIGEDDLKLVMCNGEAEINGIGEYEITAVGGNSNYDVTVIGGKLIITKDKAVITVNSKSLITVYNGEKQQVKAKISGEAKLQYFCTNSDAEDALCAPGVYTVRITAEESANFYAPEPVEVTFTIRKSEIKDENSGITIIKEDTGFKPNEEIAISEIKELSEEEGKLPDSYEIAQGYEIGIKEDAQEEAKAFEGEITVIFVLPKGFATRETVEVALVTEDGMEIKSVEVNEDGTVSITGTNLKKVLLVEKQGGIPLGVILIIVGLMVLLLFVFIMVKAGKAK